MRQAAHRIARCIQRLQELGIAEGAGSATAASGGLRKQHMRHWRVSYDAFQYRSVSSSAPPAQAEPVTAEAVRRKLIVGQPTHATHPQLLAEGELTPGIQAAEYAGRRQRLCDALPQGSLLVIPSASTNYMAGVIPYPYRQDPDFFYLTGLTQHAVMVLKSGGASGGHVFTLFIEAPNPERARWDGAQLDRQAAQVVFGADEVYYMDQLPRKLSDMSDHASELFFDLDRSSNYNHAQAMAVIQAGLSRRPTAQPTVHQPAHASSSQQEPGSQNFNHHNQMRAINPLQPLLHAMRLRKSPAEIQLMRRTAKLAAHGLIKCMAMTRPGIQESLLSATFEYECKARGASRMSYPAVVGSGSDACTIHYGRNDKALAAGQLLLMDAGCELHGYCSDVTRTWPISGRFTSAQRDVYEVVLGVHARCLQAVKPGMSIRQLHALSIQWLSEGIASLRLFKGASMSDIQSGLYRQVFWHSVGHWLGLDTHDTHLMGHDRPLQPGHVITVEPGLYIPDEVHFGALRGIGVRIEDDVLVTPDGCQVMSADVPTLPHEVEQLVGTGL